MTLLQSVGGCTEVGPHGVQVDEKMTNAFMNFSFATVNIQ